MRRFRILVVDDEVRILNFLVSKLKASGYDVLTASNGLEGMEQVKAQEPDLIVLDILMPKMDGLEMLKEMRSFSAVPVIILTAKGTDPDRIRGLQLGADDYLPKPFNPDELVARIEAIRRRLGPGEKREVPEVYRLGEVTVDFKNRNVVVGGEVKYLTRIEWLLLSQLITNTGRLMTYEELLTNVWGPEYRDDVQILRTWISRLRNKLESDIRLPGIIRTIPKTGYIVERPEAE
ncbi:MAG TPA: response regulator transcription factor [Dehalococcoidales bacterium]|nr:response regulator transcription factor [Dehalococcoidales bacterium]